jgi:hypothetical protein
MMLISRRWRLYKGNFEKKREKFKQWKQACYWKRVRKADKGKMPGMFVVLECLDALADALFRGSCRCSPEGP